MRVFVTGATGFIGARVVRELRASGHQVLGLTRSQAGAQALAAAGAEPLFGEVQNLERLREGARQCDAVIHTAFDHDFSRYAANCENDRQAILALGGALERGRPLLITSVTGVGEPTPGQPAIETHFDARHPLPRVASELAGEALKAEGVNVIAVRLPQVHDTVRQGLISPFIEIARATGVAAYIGDGSNRFSAAHVSDVARLYRLALEHGRPQARYHAVAETGVPLRDITQAIAEGMGVPVRSIAPEEAAAHFGPMALFAGLSFTALSDLTRAELDWRPTGPDLLSDLRQMDYATAAAP